MKSYYYFLIPDALAWDMPKLYDKRLPTECYTNLADVKVRYQQLREQPYNYETAFDYITGCPYARLTIGIARNNPRGPLKIVEVRRGINYLSDDFYGPFSDIHDKMLYAMARDLIEAVGVDRIRIFNDSLAMPLRSRDMPSHLRCAAGRAIQAWASIWIVRALSNIATGRRTCLFPQAAQPPIGTQQT